MDSRGRYFSEPEEKALTGPIPVFNYDKAQGPESKQTAKIRANNYSVI
jgi:hypothetical protein